MDIEAEHGVSPKAGSLEIVTRYLDGFFRSEWDIVRSLLAENCTIIDPLAPAPVSGKSAVMELLEYCHTWGDYRGEILNVFGDDRFVAVQLWISGTVEAPPAGMTEDVIGRNFAFAECDVFELDSAQRIVNETIYADAATLQMQLGQEF